MSSERVFQVSSFQFQFFVSTRQRFFDGQGSKVQHTI